MDVAHDNGLKTGFYATKAKFVLYDQSFGPTTGALDITGADNGRDKIDVYSNPDLASATMMSSLLSNMGNAATRSNYTFVHFHDPDTAGHASNWDVTEPPAAPYMDAVRAVDGYLGQIFAMIAGNPSLAGHTAVLLTADHGGTAGTTDHSDATNVQDYKIPFYAWGAGITSGDLYAMNAGSRLDPGTGRPLFSDLVQPIRNGDIGNLSMKLLGLGAIPGSSINANQSLAVPEPGSAAIMLIGIVPFLARRKR